jgi:hypothetical protein
LWKIEEGDTLRVCERASLDLEVRIEKWLEQDITILDPDLMVIGRQVETDFSGVIDLLCINDSGDMVIVELKRDKTPREVTAQVLDYASWVADLPSDRITKIADQYLAQRGPLGEAFKQRFGKDLPDSLNENHRMLVVGSQIDSSSERIISYLSNTYGVDINAVTFQYFKSPNTGEFLARVFLIEPSQVEYQTLTKGSTKRLPNLTYEELEEIAKQNGVGELYKHCVSGLQAVLGKHTTRSSIGFTATLDGSRKTIFGLVPKESSAEKGLRFQIYTSTFARAFKMTENQLTALLPERREVWTPWPGTTGVTGYFAATSEVDRFITGLNVPQG